MMSAPLAMIRSAAMAMACRPLEQKRLTVMAGTLTGRPEATLTIRARLSPCDPSGMAQPRITSSICAGSSLPFVWRSRS